MTYRLKALILVYLLSFISIHANIYDHTFDVEKGMIIYDIVGGGVLTNETNLSLKGKATLRFKDWGSTLLAEDEGVVLTSGALISKQHIKSLEKQTKGAVYTVDYQNKKIHERKHSISTILKEQNTKGLEKTGEANVAGFTCQVWEGLGIKKCIYKGLPLKVESEILGIFYRKVAREVVFDIENTVLGCELPNYPKENFALFTSALKTKNNTKAKCFTDVLKEVAYSVEQKTKQNGHSLGIDKKDKRYFLNKIGHKIFDYQKSLLPQLLQSMKKTRECLQIGSNPFEVNQCMEQFYRMKDKLVTGEDDYIILWNERNRKQLLDKIEDEVVYLQSRIPCVNRSKNISDLSACMK